VFHREARVSVLFFRVCIMSRKQILTAYAALRLSNRQEFDAPPFSIPVMPHLAHRHEGSVVCCPPLSSQSLDRVVWFDGA
jgi:hypothetical protein